MVQDHKVLMVQNHMVQDHMVLDYRSRPKCQKSGLNEKFLKGTLISRPVNAGTIGTLYPKECL